MPIPLRQYNIMDAIGNAGGGYDDFQDFDFGMQPSPTFPRGAITRIGAQDMGGPPQPMQQQPNIAELMRQFYTPETQATDAFNKLVQAPPQRNKPGIGRRLAASAGALGAPKGKGIETAEQFMYAPFMRDTQDWMARMDPTFKAAQLENTANANERQLAGSMAQYTMNERRQTETERKNQADEKIRADRAAVYRFKAENPNIRIVTPKGGNITGIDPLTGRSVPILDSQGRPISTGSLTDEDAINLRGEWGVEAAKARGAEARSTEETRQTGRENLQWDIFQQGGKTYRINRVTGNVEEVKIPEGTINKPGTPPRTTGAGGGNTELTVQRQRFNTAKRLADTVPGASKWIRFTSPTTFRIEQPGMWTSEADKQLYQSITQQIYGAQQPTGSGVVNPGRGGGPGNAGRGGQQPQQQPQSQQLPAPPPGRVYVYKNGQPVGTVPANQVEQAKAAGYEVR